MSVQEHFPELFRPKTDRRQVQVNSVVRICPSSSSDYRGMWLVVKDVGVEFLTGLVYVDGEDPILTRVSRLEVESADRMLFRLTGKKVQ